MQSHGTLTALRESCWLIQAASVARSEPSPITIRSHLPDALATELFRGHECTLMTEVFRQFRLPSSAGALSRISIMTKRMTARTSGESFDSRG